MSVLNHTGLPRNTRRQCRWLAHACLPIMALLPVAVAWYWLTADRHILELRANLPPESIAWELDQWQRVGAALLAEIPVLLLLFGVECARRCFRLFASGVVFSGEVVILLRRFAGWGMISAAADVICGAVASVVLTLGNPPGLRHVAIGVGSDQLFLLFFASAVWLMAAAIAEGQAIAAENSQFV